MSCFAVVSFSLFMYYVSSGAMINYQMSNVVECSMCELHVPGGTGNLTVVKYNDFHHHDHALKKRVAVHIAINFLTYYLH